MTIKRCHHHGFTVSNIDRSLAFYRDGLGLECLRVSPRRDLPSYDQILGYPNVALTVALLRHPTDEFLLELIQYEQPEGKPRPQENAFIGASHLAFDVEDVDALYERLCDAGFEAINPPVDIERDGAVVARAVYVLDPDGISVELFQEA
ncbi:MAG: hypothetical protein HN712_18570 [Gemmatimonadetes bacterium]|jgi:glyoxylase I family protein|nr:hypothetical protein [Gemmatimonadota bacterium]MBT6147629.1 hypothetical protein [Gemmatimonadota bacterium]MBT7862330.1 hypothetical protein [Gemmatimonadota bacterium]